MIPEIQNTLLRRIVLVLTVAAIVIILGPVYLIESVLGWVEREFEVNLRAIWRGKTKGNAKL